MSLLKCEPINKKGFKSLQYLRGEIELTKYDSNTGYPHDLEANAIEDKAEQRAKKYEGWYR